MSFTVTQEQERQSARPHLDHAGPIRHVGSLYRTAEGAEPGTGGVPLVTAEDAIVAAVRMAYNVADAQVQRSGRLAQRLRHAGDRAVGEGSERKAVDAAEQLVFKTMMSALSWLEAAVAEGDNPLRRLMAVEYKFIGSMLGIGLPDRPASPHPGAPPEPAREGRAAAPEAADSSGGNIPLRRVRIFLDGDVKRPVCLRRCEVTHIAPLVVAVTFYHGGQGSVAPLEATFAIADRGQATLTIATNLDTPSGHWKAAICDADGEQIGLLEIEI